MFVFPMLGRSKRFYDAGYTLPKYELPLGRQGLTLFDHSVMSFRNYFDSDFFVFICRKESNAEEFVRRRLLDLGVSKFLIIGHQGETRGQAESVALALTGLDVEEDLFIFNIDTILFNFIKNPKRYYLDGYLEVFRGLGDHWSFVKPKGPDSRVVESVAEKTRISDLCSNGLYYFNSVSRYLDIYYSALADSCTVNGEYYVAPLYNYLIKNGGMVEYLLVDLEDIGFSGTPQEYESMTRL